MGDEVLRGVEAAARLGVSPQRVVQLWRAGVLERAYHPDGWAGITVESVERRLAAPPHDRTPKPKPETWKGRRRAAQRQRVAEQLEAARREYGSRRLLTYAEVCGELGISRRTLRRVLERGELTRVDIDQNNKRITWESVQAYRNR